MIIPNVSGLDRLLRILLGLTLIWAFGLNTGGFGLLIGVLIGGYILITGLAGYDLVYSLFGVSTTEQDDTGSEA